MNEMILNIAMDGPVGAGKSSIAKAVADRVIPANTEEGVTEYLHAIYNRKL